MAATVSVAHNTLDKMKTSVKVKELKNMLLIIMMTTDKNRNPSTVPITPKKLIIPKF